jgi:hypothetical protein
LLTSSAQVHDRLVDVIAAAVVARQFGQMIVGEETCKEKRL